MQSCSSGQDGVRSWMPLAIELAAARVRALTLAEIVEGLYDRFRLLTGGSRTAVPRQQTLRSSLDWSHALLSEPQRILFRRLATFVDGFDLEAVRAVACGEGIAQQQGLDLLTSLVDKSLVVTEEHGEHTRYRLVELVRQYASDKLGESSEADDLRARHRAHYAAIASLLDQPGPVGYEPPTTTTAATVAAMPNPQFKASVHVKRFAQPAGPSDTRLFHLMKYAAVIHGYYRLSMNCYGKCWCTTGLALSNRHSDVLTAYRHPGHRSG